MTDQEIRSVPVSQVVPGDNDRHFFDQSALEELAGSISAHGLAQPITVRPLAADMFGNATFQIVAGERRFRAISQILKWETIPAIVREDLDDEAASAIMLVENTSRTDLNPIEEARAYQARIDRYGWSVEKVAQVAGRSVDLVQRRLSLLSLVEEAQTLVAHGNMPLGHAEYMTKLDHDRQRTAFRVLSQTENMPFRMFRQMVDELYQNQSQIPLWDLENFWLEQVVEAKDAPRKGANAQTGAPTNANLPMPQITRALRPAQVLDRYIAELIASGREDEAAVVGTVYEAMVRAGIVAVPQDAVLVVR